MKYVMIPLLSILIFILLLVICIPYENLKKIALQETFVIEDCEYITVKGLHGFSHKYNCSNPIHGGKND